FIGVAAVADWRAASTRNKKIKKDGKTVPPLMLEENPDILKTISNHDKRPPLVIGFAAETNNVLEHARAKLARKNCDWIVANDVSGDVMGGDENTMILLSAAGTDSWPKMSKQAAARKLAEKIAQSITKEEA
ncbi:MAG TPA: bifunctional phosphopantothenoylcysteine decarboxylase/phosphopantothenate synthase, partial [Hellea balneolensis]|nr:bifunctional phosphopantothenoylcysteine decarboxylase/phosphopantothenate synthase [Hellea balneolensis]